MPEKRRNSSLEEKVGILKKHMLETVSVLTRDQHDIFVPPYFISDFRAALSVTAI